MQRVDSPRPSYRTLSAMPNIRASSEAFRKASNPSLQVPVPDKDAPGGILAYYISPTRDELTGITSYELYVSGERVIYPSRVFARHQNIFASHLSRVAPGVAKRMYQDLHRERDERPLLYLRTLPEDQTPPPHYSVSPIARARFSVVHTNEASQEHEDSYDRSSTIEDRMREALVQIRKRVVSGEIPVVPLEDGSGYYANIVDYQHGQLHQIGISSRQVLPWHVVFQLQSGIDPMRDQYPTPKPMIRGGQIVFDSTHVPYMRPIDTRQYNRYDSIERQRIKSALGTLGSVPGRRVVTSGGGSFPSGEYPPHNVIPIRGVPPDSLQYPLQQHGPQELSPQRQGSPVRQEVRSSLGTHHPQPGDYGWRLNDIVDSTSVPAWLKREGGSVQVIQQPLERSALDEYGLPPRPRPIRRSLEAERARVRDVADSVPTLKPGSLQVRDLINFSTLPETLGGKPAEPLKDIHQTSEEQLDLRQGELSEQPTRTHSLAIPIGEPVVPGLGDDNMPAFPSVATLPPLPSAEPYNPYQLVSFGGQTIHTTYSFI